MADVSNEEKRQRTNHVQEIYSYEIVTVCQHEDNCKCTGSCHNSSQWHMLVCDYPDITNNLRVNYYDGVDGAEIMLTKEEEKQYQGVIFGYIFDFANRHGVCASVLRRVYQYKEGDCIYDDDDFISREPTGSEYIQVACNCGPTKECETEEKALKVIEALILMLPDIKNIEEATEYIDDYDTYSYICSLACNSPEKFLNTLRKNGWCGFRKTS